MESSFFSTKFMSLCTPDWNAYLLGDIGHVQLGQQAKAFFRLADTNRDLKNLHETTCAHYFQQHFGMIKPSNQKTWAQALSRVFDILVHTHCTLTGKLLCAGVTLDVCQKLTKASMKECVRGNYNLCAKLFHRGLHHSASIVLKKMDLKTTLECLPLLVQHDAVSEFIETVQASLAELSDDDAITFFKDQVSDAMLERLDSVVECSVSAQQSLIRFVTACQIRLLLCLTNVYFSSKRVGATVLTIFKDPTLWQMWSTGPWWLSLREDKPYTHAMYTLIKQRPDGSFLCPGLPSLVLDNGHSIMGTHLSARLALKVPGWRCLESVNYTAAIEGLLNTGDVDSLDQLVNRGLSVPTYGAAALTSWVSSCYQQLAPIRAQERAIRRLFYHGCRVTKEEVDNIKQGMRVMPAELCLSLLMILRDNLII